MNQTFKNAFKSNFKKFMMPPFSTLLLFLVCWMLGMCLCQAWIEQPVQWNKMIKHWNDTLFNWCWQKLRTKKDTLTCFFFFYILARKNRCKDYANEMLFPKYNVTLIICFPYNLCQTNSIKTKWNIHMQCCILKKQKS